MKHPLLIVPLNSRKGMFWALFISTIAVMAVLNVSGATLRTSAAPYGIISYEFAGSVARVNEILASWNVQARMSAAFNLGFDYLWMPLYSTTIALACIWGGLLLKERQWPLGSLGLLLAWAAWLAAVFDGVENIALCVMLFGIPADPWPLVSQLCAVIKFSFVFLGMVYAFYALVVRLVIKPPPQSTA